MRFGLLGGLLLAAGTAAAAPTGTLDGGMPVVIAHRGASGYLPEHTLGGYELAIRMGADYIEPDLQLTSDGRLVAMHDATLTRTTNVASLFQARNGAYRVSDFSLAEIKQLTVKPTGTGQTSYPGFTPTSSDPYRVPTFEEVIALARQKSSEVGRVVGIYPEAKQADPVMEDKILAALKATGYQTGADKVFIQSFSADTLKSIGQKQQALGLDIPLVQLGYGGADQLAEIATYADGAGFYTGLGTLDEAFIQQAHALGLLVHGWTFSDPDAATALAEYERYFGWGIDGVFSNYPDLARAALDDVAVSAPGALGVLSLGLVGLIAGRRRQQQ
jgi:glycerophosphoryl diester phosphodiesterase